MRYSAIVVVILEIMASSARLPTSLAEEDHVWAIPGRIRLTVRVDPGARDRANSPVGVQIDVRSLFAKAGITSQFDPASACVARPQPAGDPKNPNHANGQMALATGDFFNEGTGRLWWRMKDAGDVLFHVYLGTSEDVPKGPREQAIVGIGDQLHFNDGHPDYCVPGRFDWDGDGLPDRLEVAVRAYEFGQALDDRLGYGVYFYKNVGSAREHFFGKPIRLKGADGKYLLGAGGMYFNLSPADWDRDGSLDLIGFRGDTLYWAKSTNRRDALGVRQFEHPRPAVQLEKSGFRERLPGPIDPPSFYFSAVALTDWEGDGDEDLLLTISSYHRTAVVDPRQAVIPYGPYLQFFEVAERLPGDSLEQTRFGRPVVLLDERGLPLTSSGGGAEYTDWDGDGDRDLSFFDDGDRPLDGAVQMLAANDGTRRAPMFLAPVRAGPRRGGVVPHGTAYDLYPRPTGYAVSCPDLNADGIFDLVLGSYTGQIKAHRNCGVPGYPRFDRGATLEAGGKPIDLVNWLLPQTQEPSHWGPQGPAEALAACMLPTFVDWDNDSDLDLFVSGQRWQTMYYENQGTRTNAVFAAGQEVRVNGDAFEFAWRSKLAAGDMDGDGVCELVGFSDTNGCFHSYHRTKESGKSGRLHLVRGPPLLSEAAEPLRGNYLDANNNGDQNALLVDWDGDSDLDLLNGSLYGVWWLENVGDRFRPRFRTRGRLQAGGEPIHTFNHAGAFEAVDFSGDGRLDLLMGAESPPAIHLFDRRFIENDLPTATVVSVAVRKQRP